MPYFAVVRIPLAISWLTFIRLTFTSFFSRFLLSPSIITTSSTCSNLEFSYSLSSAQCAHQDHGLLQAEWNFTHPRSVAHQNWNSSTTWMTEFPQKVTSSVVWAWPSTSGRWRCWRAPRCRVARAGAGPAPSQPPARAEPDPSTRWAVSCSLPMSH